MSLRENFGKIPAWKAVIILILAFSFALLGIEEIFVSRIFHVLDKSISHFENIFKEDNKEIDRDFQEFNERQEYDRAESDLNSFKMSNQPVSSRQEYICAYETINKKLEKFYSLSYVKHNITTRYWITKQITDNKKSINDAIAKGEFNPSKYLGTVQ